MYSSYAGYIILIPADIFKNTSKGIFHVYRQVRMAVTKRHSIIHIHSGGGHYRQGTRQVCRGA
mgnify:CR=1 FL=1